MKILITSDFCIRTGVDVKAGDIVEASRVEALEALYMRRAIEVSDDFGSESPESDVPAARLPGRMGKRTR